VNVLPIVFLVAFIAGLVLAVFAMLHGVEHARASRNRAPSAFFNLPAFAAFAIGFGAAGYPIATRTTLPDWGVLLIAAGAGALAISAMITLLARWALRGLSDDTLSESEEIQGHFAVVTRDISTTAAGEIRYEMHGRQITVPAKGLTAKHLVAGEEVVIDRIEDGTAMVEEWSVVEQRL
jgi:membrane protein implicated in regulation of membrane protease activity